MKGRAIMIVALVAGLGLIIGCAGMSFPSAPGLDEPRTASYPGSNEQAHMLWGIWEVVVDESGITATEVTDRVLSNHFDVKAFLKLKCPDCLSFSNLDHDAPNQLLSVDVTLRNPTKLQAADIRGIVLSNNPEVYLANPDDYTTLYDQDDPPDINPFRLFGKDLTDGIVGEGVEVTEHFTMHYDSIPFIFKSAVDVVFPVDSDREPYAILNQSIDGDLDTTGTVSRNVEVEVHDRNDDAGAVTVVCDDLSINLVLTPDADGIHYHGSISNTVDAPGDYQLRIEAADSVTSWILYDYLTITVSEQIGGWDIARFAFDNGGCPRDIASGYDPHTGFTALFFSTGSGCDELGMMGIDFTNPVTYIGLHEIDPLVPGFSPHPATRLDASQTGGIVFFNDSTGTYDDPFLTAPTASLLVSVFPGPTGDPAYINYGDGDAGRVNPTNLALRGVDVTEDTLGDLYALWADPAGSAPPEIYGLSPDFTRHDIFMGGVIPSQLVGSGPGKISPQKSELRAIEVADFSFDAGTLWILESTGTSSEIEVFGFNIDYTHMTTTFTSVETISVGSVEAVDLEAIMQNSLYSPNPESRTVAVLVQGSSGSYVKMFSATTNALVEEIGSGTEPILSGTAGSLDVDNDGWQIIVVNAEDQGAVLSWVL